MYPEFDEKDKAILTKRARHYRQMHRHTGPQVGDHVDFACGTSRRISHVWQVGDDWGIQTSDGGSWYLGNGYCSFSGGLYPTIPASTLTYTGMQRPGKVWFFHHDHARAHNGVYTEMPFYIYSCSLPANK